MLLTVLPVAVNVAVAKLLPERIAFARRLVATTDRAFTGVTSRGAIARLVRLD